MKPPSTPFYPNRPLARPDALPVLPIHQTVVFPMTVISLPVAGERARTLVHDVTRQSGLVAVVAQRDGDSGPPRPHELYAMGTASLLQETSHDQGDTLEIAVQGLERVRILEWVRTEPYFVAQVQWLPDVIEGGLELDERVRAARHLFLRSVSLRAEPSGDLTAAVDRAEDARQLVYLIASTTPMTTEARQQLLEHGSVLAKLGRVIEHLRHDIALQELTHNVADESRARSKAEREALLRKQLEVIRCELGEGGPDQVEAGDLRAQLSGLPLPTEARKEVDRELDRLDRTAAGSPEYGMIRNYLDWVAKMPWGRWTGQDIDILRAKEVLDSDHYGLEKVKDRIIEYLAVRRLRAARCVRAAVGEDTASREPILCLVGPPGVGKTSLGQSIARSLGREFARMALGGVHDEAEIRGHRRTYIGAMPGRILQALSRCGASDPVLMLDEIDKLGAGFHGDPSGALLEVLDPAHNHAFVDSYLGVPFDLSRVLFVCTANAVDTIPPPLFDRMEVIPLAGYIDVEKILIARRHLLPKAIAAHGLWPDEFALDDDAVHAVVRGYTREAGVRGLARELAGVLRKVARGVSEGQRARFHLRADQVVDYLGPPRFVDEVAEPIDRPGIAIGLAWMPTGGDILIVEATMAPGDEDRLLLTGMLGDVMRESAQAALSYLRASGERLGADPRLLEKKTVHVHVPAGAVPKDGPSAGVTILVALASLVTGRVVRSDVAMSGEITLRGRVLPVGGIKEKVLAAHRAGLRTVVFPRRTEHQLDDVPREVLRSVQLVFAESAEEVLQIALGPCGSGRRERTTEPVLDRSRASTR